MKTSAWVLLGFALSLGAARANAACDNPTLAEQVRAQIASTCICSSSTNHGRYVSCVAHAVRDAVANGLPTNCRGTVTRCAARSTCGKKTGFVTCCFASAGKCENGMCEGSDTQCTMDTECPARTRCSVKSSGDHCTAQGGSPGTGSCCDAVCSVTPPSPSGAFLD